MCEDVGVSGFVYRNDRVNHIEKKFIFRHVPILGINIPLKICDNEREKGNQQHKALERDMEAGDGKKEE